MRFAATVMIVALCTLLVGSAGKPVVPAGVKPVGPYTPGIETSEFLYVSGQGARDANGQLPNTFEEQVRQCLENVKAVLRADGLKMEHVVFAQVYLADMKQYDVMNRIYAAYFPKNPPARTTIGVARMPTETPVEISAIAVRNLRKKKVLQLPDRKMPVPVSPAVQVGDRVFLSGGLGREFESGNVPKDPKQQVQIVMKTAETILRQANFDLRHLAYVNIYVSPEMPIKLLAEAIDEFIADETAKTIIQTDALPFGVQLQIAGTASRDLQRLGRCNQVGRSVYCSGVAGTTRQALESLKADLEVNKWSINDVVAVNVYMDELDEFQAMNKVYASYFGRVPPTRTTVQPWKRVVELSLPPTTGVAPGKDNSPRVQISVIAER